MSEKVAVIFREILVFCEVVCIFVGFVSAEKVFFSEEGTAPPYPPHFLSTRRGQRSLTI